MIERLAWVAPALCFLAWLAILLAGRRLPRGGAPVGIAAVLVGWIGSLVLLAGVISGHRPVQIHRTWFEFGAGLRVSLGMTVDGLAVVMLVVVTTISLLVQIYSVSYMRGDPRFTLYFSNLSLFTAAMLVVVLADSLLGLLVGWEVMGICSYFLIGHFWDDPANTAAAIKAFLVTRIGDVGFLLGIIVLFAGTGSFDIGRIVAAVESGSVAPGVVTAGAVLLFCGAIGKSAQFPLHVWLPDAMAGPTPVSALIHAATMVAAGVFLVARMYPVFMASGAAMNEIALLASITMLLAAVLALVQEDLKRVLAYSTVSQLAYMMAALGVGGYAAGMFHLFTHAFFKALLFLAAGSIIHAVRSNNLRDMGGLARSMPRTFAAFTIGALALAGLPPLAGFWSKDQVLAAAWEAGFGHGAGESGAASVINQTVARVVFVVAVTTVFLTAAYIARACWLAFGGAYRGAGSPHEPDALMGVPVALLAAASVVIGLVGSPLAGHGGFARWIATPFAPASAGPSFELGLALTSTVLALAGLALGTALYRRGVPEREYLARSRPVWQVLTNGFYLDAFYGRTIVRPVRDGLATAAAWMDRRVVDGAVNAVGASTGNFSRRLRRIQTGQVQWYAAALFAGVVVVAVAVRGLVGG